MAALTQAILHRKYIVSAAIVLLATAIALLLRPSAPELPPGFVVRTHVNAAGEEVNYALYVPPDYTGREPYPLIVHLHGFGERGIDGTKQLKNGLPSAIRWGQRKGKQFRFLALFPQGLSGSWSDPMDAQTVVELLGETEKKYSIDSRRVYLTGISNGGTGTWELAAASPHRWAAIVPVCGRANAAAARSISHIPCWCFHGGADRSTPPDQARRMVAGLKSAGGKPKYTEYSGLGHAIWDNVYFSDELYQWLLEQRLP